MSGSGAIVQERRWSGARWQVLGVVVLLLAAAPIARRYLVAWPADQLQVDLEVYREAARSVLIGRPVYSYRTDAPQLLPFTYPPLAALLALPTVAVPWPATGWLWTALQLALLWFTVGIAFHPLLGRVRGRIGARAALVQGGVAGAMVWMLPVSDGIRFGQVNAILVLLCLVDLAGRRRGASRAGEPGLQGGGLHAPRLHRGVLIGVATAVKLTPGLFVMHLLVTRQWRAAGTAVGTAATLTVAAFLVVPGASIVYWTRALFDPDRLGPNAGTSNQSVRGLLLRLDLVEPWTTVVWLAVLAPVLVLGLRLAAALHRREEQVAVVAAVGMLAVLVSPVSWVHHLHWAVVLVGALIGDGRTTGGVGARARALVAGAALVWFLLPLPWWGVRLLADDLAPRWVGRVVQNGYLLGALLALVALWTVLVRDQPFNRSQAEPRDPARGGSRFLGR